MLVGLLLGIAAGYIMAAISFYFVEKDAVKNGFLKIEGKCYSLDEIKDWRKMFNDDDKM